MRAIDATAPDEWIAATPRARCRMWAAALRSDKYIQGTGGLHTRATEARPALYCGLGVLCDVARPAAWHHAPGRIETDVRATVDDRIGSLPLVLAHEVALDYEIVDRLIDMNDDWGYTFPEIADFIDEAMDKAAGDDWHSVRAAWYSMEATMQTTL